MNIRKKSSIIALIGFCLLILFINKDRILTIFDHNIIIYNDYGLLSDKDRVRLKAEVYDALTTINKVLGIRRNHTLRVKVEQKGICFSFNNGISLPIWHIENKRASVFHEITHLLANHESNRFFSEGLAVYFQEKYGEDNAFPNSEGMPLQDLLWQNRENLFSLVKLERNISYFTMSHDREMQSIAYLQAGSFITFLADRYGESSLRELNGSYDVNYIRIFGKDLSSLEEEWKEYYLLN